MTSILSIGRNRWLTHLVMAVFTAAGVLLTYILIPEAETKRIVVIGLAYVALLQLALTLLIGPWQMLAKQKRNPVNFYVRRDIGIWAGITGTIHVILGFQIHLGGQWLRYFFRENSFIPLINPFGLSNYIGLAATVILVVLLLISNDISVRWFKGKRWKNIQRFNYVLFGMVILHTFGYQFAVKRFWVMTLVAIAIAALVLFWQVRGYRFYQTYWPARNNPPGDP